MTRRIQKIIGVFLECFKIYPVFAIDKEDQLRIEELAGFQPNDVY